MTLGPSIALLRGNIPGLLQPGLQVLHPHSQSGDRADWTRFDVGLLYDLVTTIHPENRDVLFITQGGTKLRHDWRFVWLDLDMHFARLRCAKWVEANTGVAVWNYLDGPGSITSEVSAQVLAACVRRVHADGQPVRNVLRAWWPEGVRRIRCAPNGSVLAESLADGWMARSERTGTLVGGPEIGTIGEAMADAVLHADGFWCPGFSETRPDPEVRRG